MGLRPLEIFLLLQRGDRLWSSESDVYRRQILTTKVGPRAARVKGLVYSPLKMEILAAFESKIKTCCIACDNSGTLGYYLEFILSRFYFSPVVSYHHNHLYCLRYSLRIPLPNGNQLAKFFQNVLPFLQTYSVYAESFAIIFVR